MHSVLFGKEPDKCSMAITDKNVKFILGTEWEDDKVTFRLVKK